MCILQSVEAEHAQHLKTRNLLATMKPSLRNSHPHSETHLKPSAEGCSGFAVSIGTQFYFTKSRLGLFLYICTRAKKLQGSPSTFRQHGSKPVAIIPVILCYKLNSGDKMKWHRPTYLFVHPFFIMQLHEVKL